MSYGPLKNCYKCKAPLILSDPANEGYCGGAFCLGDPVPKVASIPNGPNQKQRRAAAKRARKALG